MKYVVFIALLCINNHLFCMEKYSESIAPDISQENKQSEHTDQLLEKIRNYLDKTILGINIHNPLRRFIGSYYSMQRSLLATNDETEDLLRLIAYDIENTQKISNDSIYEALAKKHSLFSYLLTKYINQQIHILSTVKGSTLDTIHDNYHNNPSFSKTTIFNVFITKKIGLEYMHRNGLDKAMPDIPFNKNNDIHYSALTGHTEEINIQEGNLLMSLCNLKAVDSHNTITIWDMWIGGQRNSVSSCHWTRLKEDYPDCSQRTIDRNEKHLAIQSIEPSHPLSAIITKIKEKISVPVIVLFRRPTFKSHLCQQAYMKSKSNPNDLKCLQESNLAKEQLLLGFPGTNLHNRIEKQLKKLQ